MWYHAGQTCAQLKIRGNIFLQDKGRLGMGAAWWSLPQAPAGSHQPLLACFLHVCFLVLLCVRRREGWLLMVLNEPESHLWDPTPSASSLLPLVLSQRFQLGPPPPHPPFAYLWSLSSPSPFALIFTSLLPLVMKRLRSSAHLCGGCFLIPFSLHPLWRSGLSTPCLLRDQALAMHQLRNAALPMALLYSFLLLF